MLCFGGIIYNGFSLWLHLASSERVLTRQPHALDMLRLCRRRVPFHPGAQNLRTLTYHPKVRGAPCSYEHVPECSCPISAYPFAFGEDDAIRCLGPWAAFADNASPSQFFSSIVAYLFPFLGTSSYKPLRTQAFYLPAWHVDAEIEARFRDTSDEDKVRSYMFTLSSQ